MTLDELLALLPDNTTGAIGADDLRTIVTELYQRASTVGQVFAYQYTTSAVPTAGRLNVSAWAVGSSTLHVSETTDDGVLLGWGLVDGAVEDQVRIQSATGSLMAELVGPSVDNGTYRTLTLNVLEVTGTAPANNAPVALTFVAVVS